GTDFRPLIRRTQLALLLAATLESPVVLMPIPDLSLSDERVNQVPKELLPPHAYHHPAHTAFRAAFRRSGCRRLAPAPQSTHAAGPSGSLEKTARRRPHPRNSARRSSTYRSSGHRSDASATEYGAAGRGCAPGPVGTRHQRQPAVAAQHGRFDAAGRPSRRARAEPGPARRPGAGAHAARGSRPPAGSSGGAPRSGSQGTAVHADGSAQGAKSGGAAGPHAARAGNPVRTGI